jgi:hypothetical protein
MLSEQDFIAPWPDMIMSPIQVLINEYCEVEHELSDSGLEQARVTLLQAAGEFAYEEAMHGFVSDRDPAKRIPGYTPSEAEGDSRREQAVRTHSSAIWAAGKVFLAAHENLIRLARTRGYNVEALKRDRHPRALEIDSNLGRRGRSPGPS